MSELKEHLFCECDECIREYRGPLSNEMRPYYLKSEADKVIAEKDKDIAELKEERRWRKFNEEKPSEEMEGEDFLVSNGYYSVVCEWRGYWNNEPFCGDKNCDVVRYWMTIPSTPKED